jgi:hypothetical protein
MIDKFSGLKFSGGKNIAMKIPPHQYEKTIRFYKDILKLPIISEEEKSISFEFGHNRLWLDKAEQCSQAELWMEIICSDIDAAAEYFKENNITRRDEIEKLPENFKGFWISNPADIINIVEASENN